MLLFNTTQKKKMGLLRRLVNWKIMKNELYIIWIWIWIEYYYDDDVELIDILILGRNKKQKTALLN